MKDDRGVALLFVLWAVMISGAILAAIYTDAQYIALDIQQALHFEQARGQANMEALQSLDEGEERVGKALIHSRVEVIRAVENKPIYLLTSLFAQGVECAEEPITDGVFRGTTLRSAFTCDEYGGTPVQGNLNVAQPSTRLSLAALVAAKGFVSLGDYRPQSSEVTVLAGGELSIESLVCYSTEQQVSLVSLTGSVVVQQVSGCGVLRVSAAQEMYLIGEGYQGVMPVSSPYEAFVLGLR
ncbi:MAG: hypothetical protein KDD55_04220 [Bdellovibrionales bacterium]|nr:hypothetical protein [Bdellovibrionales bacterium]